MIPLEPDKYYHIFNRSNGREKIFLSAENYQYFLSKYKEHLSPVLETFCYCLVPTHFHLLIRIKEEKQIKRLIDIEKKVQPINLFISKKFSNFFSSYTQAFNKQQSRTGSLFQKNFKRKEIDSEEYLYRVINYIHFNPVNAKLVRRIEDWEFSSYVDLISDHRSFLQKEEVLALYGNRENFKIVHSNPLDFQNPFC